jgi:type I restriction enzyme S subunit
MEYFGKQIFSKDLSTYKVVHRGQFAYATNHIEEGSIGYQDLHDAAVISPMYTVFEAGKKIDDRFLFLLLKTELYRHIFEVNTSASVDRRGSLRWPDFSRIHIPLPSLEEQRAIVKVIEVADRELDRLKAKADALRQQKKGLMQQLLTGKKRVRV